MLTCMYLSSSKYFIFLNYLLDFASKCRMKIYSKTKAQVLQATRKAMKKQQMMARQIDKEYKKKVSYFLMQIFFQLCI